MKKEQIVEVLETIATLLELQEENPFKIRAYTNAARSIETWGGNLREMAEEDRLRKFPGVGKAIAGKICELVLTGSSKFYDELRAQFPPSRFWSCFRSRAWARKRSRRSTRSWQINSIADLAQACATGRVAEFPALARQPRKNWRRRSRTGQNMPAAFR